MAFLLARRPGRRRTLGEIEVGETIGEGANSKVKLGRDRKTGRLVVLKIMDPEVFRTREVQQELEILRYFGEPRNRHPNVCGLVSVMHDVELASKHGTPRSSYDTRRVSVIVTEYADGGDLFSYVASGIPFNEETSRAVFQQVVRGVIHLHKHGVVHLDIKPENIIITRTGQVKITDFGLSEIVRPLRSRKGPRRAKALPDSAGPRSSAATRSRAGPIRAVASMTSLESMVPRGGRGPALSMDSSPSPSPLAHFFPSGTPSRRSSAVLGGPPPLCPGSGGRLSTPRASIASAPQFDLDEVRLDGEVDDDELFAAISTGRTRPTKSDTPPVEDDPQPAQLQHPRGGIRSSASLNSLVDYPYSGGLGGGMGRKVTSCTSISSLDSNISFNSRGSGRSTASRYSAPRLVVNSRSGTLCYQAPEVNYGNYDGSKADVFSLGIVLHVLLYGVLPFENGECFNMNSDISEGAKSFSDGESSPEWCPPKLLQHDIELSEEAVDLLRGMLLLNPQTRFSLKDVARHVWVQAAQVRGSSRLVAALVQRREGHVLESRKNQNYLRKARKRCRGGAAASETMPPEVDDLFG